MAQINPINLGQPSLTIGPQAQLNPLQLAAIAQQQAQKTAQPPPSMPARDTNYSALAAALQGTPQVTGGTWGEAIADALAGGLRGRAAAQEQARTDKQQAAQNMWQQALQQRQEDQWNTQDKQQQRLSDWAQTQGPDAQVDPQSAYQTHEQQAALANQPMTPYQTQSLAESHRHNLATEANSGGSGVGSGVSLTPQDVQDLGSIVGLSGMPVYELTGSRDRRINTPVISAAMETRRRLNLSPGDYAAVRLAYTGDRASIQHLQRTRDQVAANEGAAQSALGNISSMLNGDPQRGIAPLPRNQISSIPSGNTALQAFNRTLGGNGPLAAYVGAIITARTEYARVISGSNSPPVEAMHEAERVLPTNITPAQLADVTANLQREMQFRTGAFDSVLQDIQNRVGFRTDAPAALPPGGGDRPAGVPPNFVRDPQTGRWRAP